MFNRFRAVFTTTTVLRYMTGYFKQSNFRNQKKQTGLLAGFAS